MMNRKSIRVVAVANLALGCLLLQGCGMFGKKTEGDVTAIPELEPVEVTPAEQIEPVTTVDVVPEPVPLPAVQSTTPYTIQKGDTISAIAFKYKLRWQDVLAVNPGITPTRMRIGQVIQLPGVIDLSRPRSMPVTTPKVTAPKVSAPAAAAVASDAVTYVVKAGDSLSVIAYRHGIKTAALRAANGIKGDKIIVGQKLKVPGARKTPAPAAAAKKASAPKTEAPKAAAEAKPVKSAAPAAAVAPPPAPPKAAVESEPVKVETAAPPAPAAAEVNVQTYTVKEGEDLYAVAIRWGVSPTDLKTLNNLSSTELKAGTVLKIPGAAQ
ncbi:MAG: LysM peptidoglycan-binding domain-containing protein [Kiritimatiellae bacterium]|nr:LysM peptidoglycan-binding domain-containing protein [Kiritimatiellia bacterium]